MEQYGAYLHTKERFGACCRTKERCHASSLQGEWSLSIESDVMEQHLGGFMPLSIKLRINTLERQS
jgi:subtilisin-like proprotein convertase family protein